MRVRLAMWLNRALVVEDGDRLRPPGAEPAVRLVEPDGSELTVMSRGDSLDCFQGKRMFSAFTISPRTALRLAWFLFWSYWVRGTWCGVKLWLWNWTMSVLFEEEMERVASKWPGE